MTLLKEPPSNLLEDASLFLDFDGTLVELAPTPDAVQVDDSLRDLLSMLADRLDGRLALLSGRAAGDVRAYVDPIGIAIGGSHGLEHAPVDGGEQLVSPPAEVARAVRELEHLETSRPGVLVERKPFGVALHYRRAPDAEALCLAAAQRTACATGMELQLGKMVVELKMPGGDKGQALRRFMAEPPFAGTRPVFLGDDLTDENGFAAAGELGGAGVLVGDERATAALYRLADVASVRRWLCAALEAK